MLTNVGLEHTRWLGPTIGDIAREKLAVVAPGACSCSGRPTRRSRRSREATRRRIVRPPAVDTGLPGYQRTNFAVACAAPASIWASWTRMRSRAWPRGSRCRGGCRSWATRPLTILDGAHNPSGVAALAAALPEREWTGVVSILDDKDAGAMLRALLGRCRRIVCTAAPNPRALPPATLASLVEQLGGEAEIVGDPRAALQRAREIAGPEGAVIVTGSIYLIADLVSAPGARRASAL